MNIDSQFNFIRNHINNLENEIKRLQLLTKETEGKKDLPPFQTTEILQMRYATDNEYQIQKHIEQLNTSLQKDLQEVLPIRDAAVEHNKEVKTKAVNLFEFLRVPKYQTQQFSRRKTKTAIPWDVALGMALPTDSGINSLISTVKDRVSALEKRLEEIRRKKADEERKRQQEKQEINRKVQVAMLRKELSLPDDASEYDIENALLKQHPYAILALACEQTRNDWSEGPWRVHDALDQFSPQTKQDAAIFRCLRECLENFDDGRVFRDCEWNYMRLWEIVHVEHPGLADKLRTVRGGK